MILLRKILLTDRPYFVKTPRHSEDYLVKTGPPLSQHASRVGIPPPPLLVPLVSVLLTWFGVNWSLMIRTTHTPFFSEVGIVRFTGNPARTDTHTHGTSLRSQVEVSCYCSVTLIALHLQVQHLHIRRIR